MRYVATIKPECRQARADDHPMLDVLAGYRVLSEQDAFVLIELSPNPLHSRKCLLPKNDVVVEPLDDYLARRFPLGQRVVLTLAVREMDVDQVEPGVWASRNPDRDGVFVVINAGNSEDDPNLDVTIKLADSDDVNYPDWEWGVGSSWLVPEEEDLARAGAGGESAMTHPIPSPTPPRKTESLEIKSGTFARFKNKDDESRIINLGHSDCGYIYKVNDRTQNDISIMRPSTGRSHTVDVSFLEASDWPFSGIKFVKASPLMVSNGSGVYQRIRLELFRTPVLVLESLHSWRELIVRPMMVSKNVHQELVYSVSPDEIEPLSEIELLAYGAYNFLPKDIDHAKIMAAIDEPLRQMIALHATSPLTRGFVYKKYGIALNSEHNTPESITSAIGPKAILNEAKQIMYLADVMAQYQQPEPATTA